MQHRDHELIRDGFFQYVVFPRLSTIRLSTIRKSTPILKVTLHKVCVTHCENNLQNASQEAAVDTPTVYLLNYTQHV